MFRKYCVTQAIAAIGVGLLGPCLWAGTSSDWLGLMDPVDQPMGGIRFGARPGHQDGYDGQPSEPYTTPGVYVLFFRTNGSGWSGPTGFYAGDLESPIPPGGSHTWHDIRLWSCDYTPSLGDRVRVNISRFTPAPAGWWGQLVLDYTPESMNWTGQTEWWFPLGEPHGYGIPSLPCPITDDPFNPDNVTRMHLTVYTTPEPNSLAALGLALAGLGAVRLRRRR